MDLQLSVRAGRSCTVVRVEGELDMDTSAQLQDFLQDVVDAGAQQVVLDCAGLAFMDSSGLGLLMVYFKLLRDRGGRLCLAAVQPLVRTMLTLSTVDRVVDAYESVDAAEDDMPPVVD
jgi:anti-sigma B factor antagonist